MYSKVYDLYSSITGKPLPQPRWAHELVTVAGGDLVLMGGYNYDGKRGRYYSDVWRLSCSNGINKLS